MDRHCTSTCINMLLGMLLKCSEKLSFTYRMLLQTIICTRIFFTLKCIYILMLLNTTTCKHRQLSHTKVFTHKCCCIEVLLHTEHFCKEQLKLAETAADTGKEIIKSSGTNKSRFYRSFWQLTHVSWEGGVFREARSAKEYLNTIYAPASLHLRVYTCRCVDVFTCVCAPACLQL